MLESSDIVLSDSNPWITIFWYEPWALDAYTAVVASQGDISEASALVANLEALTISEAGTGQIPQALAAVCAQVVEVRDRFMIRLPDSLKWENAKDVTLELCTHAVPALPELLETVNKNNDQWCMVVCGAINLVTEALRHLSAVEMSTIVECLETLVVLLNDDELWTGVTMSWRVYHYLRLGALLCVMQERTDLQRLQTCRRLRVDLSQIEHSRSLGGLVRAITDAQRAKAAPLIRCSELPFKIYEENGQRWLVAASETTARFMQIYVRGVTARR